MNNELLKVMWKKTLEDGLGMGLRNLIIGVIVITCICVWTNLSAFNGMVNETPTALHKQVTEEFFKFYTFFMAPVMAFWLGWLLSFQLFAPDKEEKIIETLLATPIDIKVIYAGKVLGAITVIIPAYFLTQIVNLTAFFSLAQHTLNYVPSFFELSWLNHVATWIVGPLFAIGVVFTLTLIQILAKNPRVPSIIAIFVAMVFGFVTGTLQKQLVACLEALLVYLGIVLILILIPGFIVLHRRISTETVLGI